MLISGKKEAFKDFYLSTEGKKILAYAEMFLEQLKAQIDSEMIVNFHRDYRFLTNNYEFLYRFTCNVDGTVQFLIRHRKKRFDLFSAYYCPEIEDFFTKECSVSLSHQKGVITFPLFEFAYFDTVLDKIISVSESRVQDLFIPSELINQIEQKKLYTPHDHLEETIQILKQNRKIFTTKTFATIAHTLKLIEQVIPQLDTNPNDKDERKNILTMTNLLSFEIPKVLTDHTLLTESEREKKENYLLERFHHFYLKALKISESSKNLNRH